MEWYCWWPRRLVILYLKCAAYKSTYLLTYLPWLTSKCVARVCQHQQSFLFHCVQGLILLAHSGNWYSVTPSSEKWVTLPLMPTKMAICSDNKTVFNKLCGRPPQYAPVPCDLDLLTLKMVSGSRVTWLSSMPILIFLGLSVLNLGPMYATDRQTDIRIWQTDVRHHYRGSPRGGDIIITKYTLAYMYVTMNRPRCGHYSLVTIAHKYRTVGINTYTLHWMQISCHRTYSAQRFSIFSLIFFFLFWVVR